MKTTRPTIATSNPRSATSRKYPWMTGPTWSLPPFVKRKDLLKNVIGGTEETTTGVNSAPQHGRKEGPQIRSSPSMTPRYQAYVRQSVRHGSKHPRRYRTRHESPGLRLHSRRRRLRMVWPPWNRHARKGHGADVVVTEGGSYEGAGSRHGRLPRHAHGTGCCDGDFFVTVTGNIRDPRRTLCSHERRRDRLQQQRALQC